MPLFLPNSGVTAPLTLNSGTITADAPVLDLSQTWNNGAVTFTGLKFNATNTASGVSSLLLDVQEGGVSRFSVRSDGLATATKFSSAVFYVGTTFDTPLQRAGVNNLELRSGANPFTYSGYGTYTDSGNYRRLRTTMTTGGAVTIAAEGLGTGVSGNSLTLSANGTHPVTFNGTMIQIGGTTSSFPGLVASGASLQVRLADNSARASLEAAGLGLTSALTFSDGGNVATGTSTGSKIGTGTTQKIGFWGATPIAQPSSTGETAGFTAGGGTGVTDSSTFTGGVGSTAYRINDFVKHLKNTGLLAM